jgi:hypothetical protein
MAASVPGPRFTGLWLGPAAASSGAGFPTTGDWYVAGVRVGRVSSALLAVTGAITASTSIASTTTVTSGTQLTVTTGDARVTTGNLRLGVVSAFATTEPTSAVVMKTGTAPSGAITTSGGVFSSATVVQKIIADGTVSNVET